MNKHTLHFAVISTFVIAVVIAAIVYFIPVEGITALASSLSAAMSVLFIGSAIIFLKSLGGFSQRLKHAYLLMCIGITLLGLAQLQLPVTAITGNQEFWYTATLQPIIYAGSIIMLFAGTRAFAHLFNVRGPMTSWLFTIGLSVVLAGLSLVLPHGPTIGSEQEFDNNNAASLVAVIFFSFASLHILLVKRVASAVYTNALAWLFICYVLTTMTGAVYVVYRLAFGENQVFIDYNPIIVGVLFTLSGLALLRAAYSFASIQSDETSMPAVSRGFFGSPTAATQAPQNVTSLDIVTFTANLASDSRAIDPLLDRVRVLSASHEGDRTFSDDEEATLQKVYLEIEAYLIQKEPVRVFDKASLRQRIAQQLHLSASQSNFWSKLPPL